ncbi:Signal transduction histidine kinase [Aquiflexum balticum DSM 16537]|uniref:histidine kinase n=1 Tax=Aquiflexum balticum DSM 16537 TaxID=758820 RepID=A0A1W2H2L0_9BACT|nr:hybrid sensor histidine kinase/response regulator transcription factor [Aquiflexum balticum]SMD42858.1 Signal transduction histidine kinase [Aquiflexum balticum DSM 16537]
MQGPITKIICLLFLIFPWKIQGQDTPFFSNLSIRDGLPSNIVNSIAQDRDDFIWIGTANGICRYDGKNFKIFKKEEYPSLTANEISSLLVVGEDLWVGTWKGLCKINTRTFEITPIETGKSKIVRALYQDHHRTVWIGTADGLFRFSGDSLRNYNDFKNNLSHNMIRSIYMDHLDNLWVGTYDKLNKLASGSDRFVHFDLKGDYNPSLKNNLIMDIKSSGEDDSLIWVGTETGLAHVNIHTGEHKLYNNDNTNLSNEVIKAIYLNEEGQLWLGTDFGINIFDPKSKISQMLYHNPKLSFSVANNVIWQIFEDSGGVIWFVTSNGLSVISKYSGIYTYHEVSHDWNGQTIGNQVKAMLVSRNGHKWLATLNGVIHIDPESGYKEVFDIHSDLDRRILLNNVYALEEDDLGRIWIGTAGGINVWDGQANKMYAIPANEQNGLFSNYISKFTKGADGSFWVSAWEGGLFKVAGNFNDIHSFHFEKVGDFGSEKNASGANAIWAINYDELYRIDLQTYRSTSISSFNRVSNRRSLNSIFYSKKGSLWASTTNGLIEYKPQSDEAIFHPLKIGGDFILASIAEDSQGNIWGSSSGLILKYQPVDKTFVIYPMDKEIPIKNFSDGCWSSDGEGKLYFGGDNGFLEISTKAKPNPFVPKIFISNIKINNQEIRSGKPQQEIIQLPADISFVEKLNLNYSQRSFSVDFAALHYWQPERNIYAYKLEGADKDWNYVSGNNNYAVYSNLPAGTYLFRLKGSNNHGIWNEQETQLEIKIKPPLFLSPGFIFLYVLLILILVFYSLRFYSGRLHLRNEVKLAKMEKSHSEEIALTKQQFFTNISHELRTPISLILPPIHQALNKRDFSDETNNLLKLAEKNSQRLLRVVNQILDFRKLEQDSLELKVTAFDLVGFCRELFVLFGDKAARNNIQFTFDSDIDNCTVWADTEKIESVIYNLLSNAFKFTPEKGSVHFEVRQRRNDPDFKCGAVDIRISDTGIGIDEEDQQRIFDRFYQTSQGKKSFDGSGIGLSMVAEYTKLHYGNVNVESQLGKGASFTVTLPLGNIHFPVDFEQGSQSLNLLVSKKSDFDEKSQNPYVYDVESSKPVVLIVEDYSDMVEYLCLNLKDDYHLIIANNGEEALEKTENFTPDVIISDIMMPVMDGLTFCKKIKENSKTSHIGVILLTAKSLTSQKIEGIRTGADAYLTKPFDIELLVATIEHILKRKDELFEYFKSEIITQPEFKTNGENVDDRFVNKVIHIIEANIANPDFTVEMLSDEIGMSTAHLYRKLKSLTNFSAKDIIRKYRLKKASILLKNNEGNISEIMYEVGFSNLSYFAKCFKKEFGYSPRDYQQKEIKSNFDFENGYSKRN